MQTNSSLCLAANVSKGAIPYKPRWGGASYSIVTVKELWTPRTERFDIDVDGVRAFNDVEFQFGWLYNGKFGGGGMLLNPLGYINDGYAELFFIPGSVKFGTGLDIFDDVKKGSEIMVYDEKNLGSTFVRGKTFKLINKTP